MKDSLSAHSVPKRLPAGILDYISQEVTNTRTQTSKHMFIIFNLIGKHFNKMILTYAVDLNQFPSEEWEVEIVNRGMKFTQILDVLPKDLDDTIVEFKFLLNRFPRSKIPLLSFICRAKRAMTAVINICWPCHA